MARAGILYSQVARAAASLAAAGTTPTVDAVRAALGSTGSKSTIAPMLRQWKAEHQGEAAAAAAGLPADLLEAVQAVHHRMEARSQERLDELSAAHDEAQRALTAELAAARQAGRKLEAERDQMAAELARAKAELASTRTAAQLEAVQLAVLQAEKEGLTQRLADRGAEVKLLADQLAQARGQFEHFQGATAAQRESDRQAYETRISALEHDAQMLHTYLQEHREAVAVLRAEKEGLQVRLADAIEASKEHATQVVTLTEQLTEVREMASTQRLAAEMIAARLDDAGHEIVRMNDKIIALEQENSVLRKKAADSPALKPTGSRRKK